MKCDCVKSISSLIYNSLIANSSFYQEMIERAEVQRALAKIEYIFLLETFFYTCRLAHYKFSNIACIKGCCNSIIKCLEEFDISSSPNGEIVECIQLEKDKIESSPEVFKWIARTFSNFPDTPKLSRDDYIKLNILAKAADTRRASQTVKKKRNFENLPTINIKVSDR